MVPPTIQSNLAGLRTRERALSLIWGIACVVAIAVVLLLGACFADWLIDRFRDTPIVLRIGMLLVQLGIILGAGAFFVVWPQLRRLSDTTLALWVESHMPQFRHRLISAVQLNEPGAETAGMSKELIAIVTREAEERASRVSFAQFADHRRLTWAAAVAGPVLLFALIPLAIWPGMMGRLIARQLLLPIDIPHSVQLVNVSQEVAPIGETVTLQYRVSGEWNREMVGFVTVTPKGDRTDRYPLKYVPNTEDADGSAIFAAEINGVSADITYSARIADGRTKYPSEMKIVAPPVIQKNSAWTQLPTFCGLRPDGSRYEQPQPRGDVTGIPGSAVRVRIETQEPIKEAWLELRGLDRAEVGKNETENASLETVRAKIAMKLDADGKGAEAAFDLAETLSSYRVIVKDEYGFDNKPPPRRALRVVPEPAPEVRLLRDYVGSDALPELLEGQPVAMGSPIRIPYRCDAPFGMSKARILYRVLRKHESGVEPVDEDKWLPLECKEEVEGPGLFIPNLGVFEGTPIDKAVMFHAMPSLDPQNAPGRTIGGGRYLLQTKGLFTGTGRPPLKVGDQIEYYVEVYAAQREPEASIPVGRSETRVTTVMDPKEFSAWLQQVMREDERVRQIQVLQRAVFERR